MKKKLVYKDKSSVDMGLVIQTPPVYTLPERDVERTHVPGRNGDIILDNKCYKNIEREYSLAKGYDTEPSFGTVVNGQALYEWLTSTKGQYVRLEDDYDPEVFRMATYVDTGSLTDIFDKAYTFTARFVCKPQRYLKTGELPVVYPVGQTTLSITNLYHYEAKPIIKIDQIPSGLKATTMMSIKDFDNNNVSLITLKGDPTSKIDLIINSETEECYDNNGVNSSDKISLNGMDFPILKGGDTTISIAQYDREDYEIPSYNTVIQSVQETCESAYSPKDQTIADFEDKYVIRSYNALISERENMFDANAYFTRLTEICDEGVIINNIEYALSYTIDSPNNYLNGLTVEFKGVSYNDFLPEFNSYGVDDYLELISIDSGSGYAIEVKSNKKAYVKDSNGELIIYFAGEEIIRKHLYDSSTTKEIFPDIEEIINEDLPKFIKAEVIAKGSANVVASIAYKWDLTSYTDPNPVCIYWKDKVGITGILGKAGWNEVHHNENIINYIWSGLKKSFTPNGNLLSSDTGYSVRFVCSCDTSLNRLQYDFGENSAVIFKVKLQDKSNVILYPNRSGYYKIKDHNNNKWEKYSSSSTVMATLPTNAAFKIEYLQNIPRYTNEKDWPTWLNPNPVCFNSTGTVIADILNAAYVKFKVSQSSAYYRHYITINERETIGEFYNITVGHYLKDYEGHDLLVYPADGVTIGHYFSEMWSDPADVPDFPYDRINSINNQTPVITLTYLPDWLRYEVEMKVKFNLTPKVEYTATRDTVIPGRREWVVNDGVHEDEVYYTDPNPAVGDNIYDADGEVFSEIAEINIDDNGESILSEDGDTLLGYYYRWKTSDDQYFYTRSHWYGNVNDKIYDIDGNEIGYISVEPIIFYYPGENRDGFYKYDNSNVWVHYTSGDTNNPIVKTSYKDTTMFYFVEEFPDSYEDYYEQSHVWETTDGLKFTTDASEPKEDDKIYSIGKHEVIGKVSKFENDVLLVYIDELKIEVEAEAIAAEVPEWVNYLEINRKPEGDMNPLSVEFKIKHGADGYYKSNSLVHWKEYHEGDVCLTSLVNETNTISHLIASDDTTELDDIKITIIPNWWML